MPATQTATRTSRRRSMKPPAPSSTLHAMALKAAKTGKDHIDAAEKLLTAVRPHPELYEKLIGPFELHAAKSIIQAIFTKQRREAFNMGRLTAKSQAAGSQPPKRGRPPKSNPARKRAMTSASLLVLMEFRLPKTNIRLCDAGKREVIDAAEFYQKDAEGRVQSAQRSSANSRWLMRIADGLTGPQKVRDVYDEVKLARLMDH